MDGNMFLEAALGDGCLQGRRDTARQEWVAGAAFPDLAAGGKEPDGMTMGAPVRTEQGKQRRRERDIAILGALAALDMDHHARTVDLGNAELDAFAHA